MSHHHLPLDQPSFFPQNPVVNNHFCPLLSGHEWAWWGSLSADLGPGVTAGLSRRPCPPKGRGSPVGTQCPGGDCGGRAQPALGWPRSPRYSSSSRLSVLPTPRCPGEQGDTEALKGRQRRRGIAPPPSALLPPQPGSDLSCVQSPLPPPSIPCTHHPRRLVPSWEVWTRDEPLPLKGPSGAGWHPWW